MRGTRGNLLQVYWSIAHCVVDLLQCRERERGIAIVAHECVHVQMYIADMYVCRTY